MRREVKWLPIILFAASCLLVLPISIYPADWAGWLLVYFSFVIPLLFLRVRRDQKLLFIMWMIIASHNAVSIYNVYGSVIYGAAADAINFQELAQDFATGKYPLWFAAFGEMEIGSSIYSRFLAMFYRIFGSSLLLGQSLSVIAYAFSCVVLVYLAGVLRFRFKRASLLIYGISAPAIIYCSIVMREAWQVLFFLLVVYLTIRLRISPSVLRAVLMLLCGLAFGLLHNGLFIYSILLLGVSVYWGLSGKWRNAGYKKILSRATILGIALIGGGAWLYLGGEVGGASKAIRTGDAVAYTETYREKGEQDAAANYKVAIDASSPMAFAISSSLAFIYYNFAPFPWQVTRPLDLYAATEAILRLVLMTYMFSLWRKARGERRKRYGYLIICYISLEFLWALGTGNWGTATRHHVVAYGVLVLLGAPGLVYSLERVFRRLRFRRRVSPFRRVEIKGIKAVG